MLIIGYKLKNGTDKGRRVLANCSMEVKENVGTCYENERKRGKGGVKGEG